MIPYLKFQNNNYVFGIKTAEILNLKRQKVNTSNQQNIDIKLFDKQHKTKCQKQLNKFNNTCRKYFLPEAVSYATQMYFLVQEPKCKKFHKQLKMAGRDQIIQKIIKEVSVVDLRDGLTEFFANTSFTIPTADLEHVLRSQIQGLIKSYHFDTRDENKLFAIDPDIDIRMNPTLQEKYSYADPKKKGWALESEINFRENIILSFIKVNNLQSLNDKNILPKLYSYLVNLTAKQTDILPVKQCKHLADFEVLFNYFHTCMENLPFSVLNNTSVYLSIRAFVVMLDQGVGQAPEIMRRFVNNALLLYRRRSLAALDIAAYAMKKNLYFGNLSTLTIQAFKQKKKFSTTRANKIMEGAYNVAINSDFDNAAKEYEQASSLVDDDISDEDEIKNNNENNNNKVLNKNEENKEKNENVDSNVRKISRKEYNSFRVMAATKIKNKIAENKKVKNYNKPNKKKDIVLEKSIVSFCNFAENKADALISRCKQCGNTYQLESNDSNTLSELTNEIKKFKNTLNDVTADNIHQINDAFDKLTVNVRKTCNQLGKKYKEIAKQIQLQQNQNKLAKNFFKAVLKKMATEPFQEARNEGGRVTAPKEVPDLWERCIDYFDNKSFTYNKTLDFLDCQRTLASDETLGYYVTEHSNTPNASFCISVHRYKKNPNVNKSSNNVNEDNDDEKIDANDNNQPQQVTESFDDIDENINFTPMNQLDPREWQDLDKLMGNSFTVLHVMNS
ncbi:MAG: hypothetical protein CMN56_09045 [Sneathiella sp.]|nr:hypothetical protein [Sneathiella sp.]